MWRWPFPSPLDDLPLDDSDRAQLNDAWDSHRKKIEHAVHRHDYAAALDLVGNEYRHALLYEWWSLGMMTPTELRSSILSAWDHGPREHNELGYDVWVEMFRAAGFVSDGGQQRPLLAIVAFRGQPRDAEVGMSWTRERAMAEWFRDRWVERGVDAVVLEAVVPPTGLLAIDDARNEAEVVVDPDELQHVREAVGVTSSATWQGPGHC